MGFGVFCVCARVHVYVNGSPQWWNIDGTQTWCPQTTVPWRAIKHEKALTLQHTNNSSSHLPHATVTHTASEKHICEFFFFQNRLYIKISSIMHLHYKQFIHYRNIIKHKAKPDQFITMQYVITYNGWKRKNIFFIKNSSFFTLLFLLWSVAQSAAQYTCSIGILKYCRPRPTLSGLWWQTLITLIRGLEYKYVGKWVGNICLNLMWCVGERVILCVQSQSALNKESHLWLCAWE